MQKRQLKKKRRKRARKSVENTRRKRDSLLKSEKEESVRKSKHRKSAWARTKLQDTYKGGSNREK